MGPTGVVGELLAVGPGLRDIMPADQIVFVPALE
jgi:hypothetical protein